MKGKRRFETRFHRRLVKANSSEMRGHSRHRDLFIDCVALLVAGDEICGAASWDDKDKKLFIATNNEHEHFNRITWHLEAWSTGRSPCCPFKEVEFKVVANVSLQRIGKGCSVTDEEPFSFQHEMKRTFRYYDNCSGMLVLNGDSIFKEDLKEVEEAFGFTVTVIGELQQKISPSVFFSQDTVESNNQGRSPEWKQNMVIPAAVIFKMEPRDIPLNPLQRRAEYLIDHLGYISRFAVGYKETKTQADLISALIQLRERLFRQSLAWAASMWVKKNKRKKPDEGNELTRECWALFQPILKEFYTSKQDPFVLLDVEEVKKWLENRRPSLQFPKSLRNNAFMTKQYLWCASYIVALNRLEYAVWKNEGIPNTLHERLWASSPRDKWILAVGEDLKAGVHAEMRILHHYLSSGSEPRYVGTSKKCCAHCNLVFTNLSTAFTFTGYHGIAFDWPIDEKQIANDTFVQALLGKKLFGASKQVQLWRELVENLAKTPTNPDRAAPFEVENIFYSIPGVSQEIELPVPIQWHEQGCQDPPRQRYRAKMKLLKQARMKKT